MMLEDDSEDNFPFAGQARDATGARVDMEVLGSSGAPIWYMVYGIDGTPYNADHSMVGSIFGFPIHGNPRADWQSTAGPQ